MVGDGIDDITKAAPVRADRKSLAGEGLDEPRSQSESMKDRGFRLRGPVEDQWGQSESLDPDNVGDIADEEAGHRG
jgi:hypothetical protein